MIDHLHVSFNRSLAILASERTGQQVFLDTQMPETMTPFHNLDTATTHQFIWRQTLHFLAVEFDTALGHLATLRQQQIRDGFQGRCLACTIGAQYGDDATFWHRQ